MLVLLVEDNRNLAANIIEYLALDEIECDYAESLSQAEQRLATSGFDAIVLDLNLPDGDGVHWCQQRLAEAPVLMLTARGEVEQRLEGFAAGADDYLVKPFAMPELVARLKALHRRRPERVRLCIGDLELDLTRHQATRQGRQLLLTGSGWQLLELLARRSPAMVSKQELERALWPDGAPDSDSLRSHLYRLRQVVDKPFASALICTHRGQGVSLAENHE
ncbi:response regulator transcription factor [Ferrimonas kyonanensis]|uniref:response regulator transcription factor n=1 Tax=Ferrimonas kyonanensis TaxID=364763 RepID=UPI00040935A8|nr:response regulator transcription factor [Ferrimonas kyonanensis]